MTRKVRVETLPVTERPVREKRIIQERGELALIEDGRAFGHLAYFSLKADPAYFRGGHYHLRKTEHLYVISGRLWIQLVDLDNQERCEVPLAAGQRIVIEPRCAHRLRAEQDAQVIEYYGGRYDPADDLPYRRF